MSGRARRLTGKVGEYIWAIIGPRGTLEHTGLAKWEQDYMMRVNNGKGRGWVRAKFRRERIGEGDDPSKFAP